MLYAIQGTDVPDSVAGRQRVRTQHLARLTELRDQGRLVLAGPHPRLATSDPGDSGFTGSLVVAEFPTLVDAEAWAAADPYLADGVWSGVSVQPFIQVLP